MAEAHPHEPEVSLRTMYDDRERSKTLTTRDVDALRAEHIAELDDVVRRAWEAFQLTKKGSATRAALLGTISQAIERKAKVDGALKPRALAIGIAVGHSPDRAPRVEVDMSDDAMARILATAMDLHESHGLVIDTGTDFISPIPAPRSAPTGEQSSEDDGVDDCVERL
jgi:hypothetical protein